MLLIKTAIGAILSGAFFAITGPSICFQDAGPGKPDDVAELFPSDAFAFFEFVQGPRLLKDWKEYVAAFTTPEGKAKVCENIEEAVGKALDRVPEKLLKDFKEGLPSLQRLAVVIRDPAESDFGWALIVTSSDPAFFGRILDDLKVFAAEEWIDQGARALAIRKLGESRFDPPLYVAASGARLALTTDRNTLQGILDRATGRLKGDDLRQNALYRELPAQPSEEATFRGFAGAPWAALQRPVPYGYGSARQMAYSMDQADAVFEFQKIRGMTMQATLRPGRVASKARLHIDVPCRLYDAVRQPAGPKDALRFIPPEALLAAHLNLKGGRQVWSDIEALFKRWDAIQKKAAPERAGRPGALERVEQEMERELGIRPRDLADAVGNEVAFAMVGKDILSSEEHALSSLFFVVKAADPPKAKERIEKILERAGAYRSSKEGDATLWLAKEAAEGPQPCVAMRGDVCLVAMKPEHLRAGLKASDDPKGFASRLPAEASSCPLIFSVNLKLISQLLTMMGLGLPDLSGELQLDQWSTTLCAMEKDHIQLSSTDAGFMMVGQAGLFAATMRPLFFRSMMFPAPPAAEPPQAAPPEPPALPEDELARRVEALTRRLRSDDPAARESASRELRSLGRQAAPRVAEAAGKETDGETRERMLNLLMHWKAYDALPELMDRKIQGFLAEFGEAIVTDDNNPWAGAGVAQWMRQDVGESWEHVLEPMYVNASLVDTLSHRDLLEHPAGLKKLVEKLPSVPATVKPQLAALFAFTNSASAASALLQAHAAESDAETKTYLQVALGWSAEPKAKAIVLEGFKSADPWIRRASFLAAERSQAPEIVAKLLELVKDRDPETRWNAAYTLRVVTEDRIHLNVLWPDEEFASKHASALEWWEKNKR
ncbi:MAG: hypothetical protein HY716_02765 [Planctomycetes bacterium]|nr:hypothetical protein [Planctomycetota bacterium]